MPYRLERAEIEKTIARQGFQLWRFKPVQTPTGGTP
jgi:hypothetical protein